MKDRRMNHAVAFHMIICEIQRRDLCCNLWSDFIAVMCVDLYTVCWNTRSKNDNFSKAYLQVEMQPLWLKSNEGWTAVYVQHGDASAFQQIYKPLPERFVREGWLPISWRQQCEPKSLNTKYIAYNQLKWEDSSEWGLISFEDQNPIRCRQ